MPNVIVTSTTNAVKVDFGDYAGTAITYHKGSWAKSAIEVILMNSDHVSVTAADSERWIVSHDGASSSLQVDSVNGVAPSSLSDLYEKISALIE